MGCVSCTGYMYANINIFVPTGEFLIVSETPKIPKLS